MSYFTEETTKKQGLSVSGFAGASPNNEKYFSIDSEKVKDEGENFFNNPPPVEHDSVFQRIIEALPENNDFKSQLGLKNEDKLPLKSVKVLTVRIILEIANQIKLGIRRYKEYIFVFNGQYWKETDDDRAMKFLCDASKKLNVDPLIAEESDYLKKLFEQFRMATFELEAKPLTNKTLVNFQNCTMEITSRGVTTRKHDPVDFLTYVLPYEYNENATCPKWRAFLDKMLPEKNKAGEIVDKDKSRQRYLAEYIGYVFTNLKLEKALFNYGDGDNGKSVFYETILAALGEENVTTYSLDSLCDDKGYFRARIANKLLNYCSDISSKMNVAAFKQMVSGEKIEARLPFGQPMILTKYARLAFNCNVLPSEVEHTKGYWRRFDIIHWDVEIEDSEKQEGFAQTIIQDELPGVFNWILEGLKRLQSQSKFSDSPHAKAALADFRKKSDNVAMFLSDEHWEAAEHDSTSGTVLFGAYKSYCLENNYRALGRNKFFERLEKLKIMRKDLNQPYFHVKNKKDY